MVSLKGMHLHTNFLMMKETLVLQIWFEPKCHKLKTCQNQIRKVWHKSIKYPILIRFYLEGEWKKVDWPKTVLLIKNPQFWSNQAEIPATYSTLEMNIFTKFHKDWTTIVDFLLIAKFWASLLFFVSPSTMLTNWFAYIFCSHNGTTF